MADIGLSFSDLEAAGHPPVRGNGVWGYSGNCFAIPGALRASFEEA